MNESIEQIEPYKNNHNCTVAYIYCMSSLTLYSKEISLCATMRSFVRSNLRLLLMDRCLFFSAKLDFDGFAMMVIVMDVG